MSHFIRSLTALTILVHTTTGCCAHQVHEHCEAIEIETACQHDTCHDSSSGSGHTLAAESGRERDHESEQPVPHECCSTKCFWPAPEMWGIFQVLMQDSLAVVELAPVNFLTVPSIETGDSFDQVAHLSAYALPVRAHLAHCVLLV